MPTHSRGPPAPFPIAGQVPVPIQQPPAHRPHRRIQRRVRLSRARAASAQLNLNIKETTC